KLRQTRSTKFVKVPAAPLSHWWQAARQYVAGDRPSLDKLDAATWEYGPEIVTEEVREHVVGGVRKGSVDNGQPKPKLKKVKRRYRLTSRRVVCRFDGGTSIWREEKLEPIDDDGDTTE